MKELQVETIRFLAERGIAVCAHIGLTPQSVHQLGGFKVQGRGDAAQKLIDDAVAVESAGAFAVVLEAVPMGLALKKVLSFVRIICRERAQLPMQSVITDLKLKLAHSQH